jgi:hypothetical protein
MGLFSFGQPSVVNCSRVTSLQSQLTLHSLGLLPAFSNAFHRFELLPRDPSSFTIAMGKDCTGWVVVCARVKWGEGSRYYVSFENIERLFVFSSIMSCINRYALLTLAGTPPAEYGPQSRSESAVVWSSAFFN